MAGKLIALGTAAVLALGVASALAQEAPPPECKPPASDVTANVTIATLQCRLAILERDRVREADRATIATAEAAMLSAELTRLQGQLAEARKALAAAEAQTKWGFP